MKNMRLICIFVLSLFLLECSPIADLSSHVQDASPTTVRKPISTRNYNLAKISQLKNQPHISTSPENHTSALPVSSTPAYDYINITGRIILLFNAQPNGRTLPDSGNKAGVYNNGKFIYGHSSSVFSGLHNLRINNTFSVKRNGTITNYRVTFAKRYSMTEITGSNDWRFTQIYEAIDPTDRRTNIRYDISLMTCSGSNGRFIIMASKI